MNNRSVSPAPKKSLIMAEPPPLDAGTVNKRTFTVAHGRSRYRRILILADNEVSTRIVGYAFTANSYEVLATCNVPEAIRSVTTHNPGVILLMLSSLPAICDAARQLKQHTSIKIIGFSPTPVTTAVKNVALQSGCDDYRDAFLRTEQAG
jgi:CheY-like chemotaxis protein